MRGLAGGGRPHWPTPLLPLSGSAPVALSITLFDPGLPSFECGPLLSGERFLLDLLPHFLTPHSLGFPCLLPTPKKPNSDLS